MASQAYAKAGAERANKHHGFGWHHVRCPVSCDDPRKIYALARYGRRQPARQYAE